MASCLRRPNGQLRATDGSMLSKGVRPDAMRMIERHAKENRSQLWQDPGAASGLRLECGCITVSLGGKVTEAMLGLNKWAEARERVVEGPGIRGTPVLRGTRVGVHEAADALAGDGPDAALKGLPTLCREDLEAAALFAKVYPRTRRPRSKNDGRRLIDRQVVDILRRADAESAIRPLTCISARVWLRRDGRQQTCCGRSYVAVAQKVQV